MNLTFFFTYFRMSSRNESHRYWNCCSICGSLLVSRFLSCSPAVLRATWLLFTSDSALQNSGMFVTATCSKKSFCGQQLISICVEGKEKERKKRYSYVDTQLRPDIMQTHISTITKNKKEDMAKNDKVSKLNAPTNADQVQHNIIINQSLEKLTKAVAAVLATTMASTAKVKSWCEAFSYFSNSPISLQRRLVIHLPRSIGILVPPIAAK